jgi:hypothetical protein
MNAPLDVFARLSLVDGEGKEISVRAEDEVITVTVPSLWIGRPVLKQLSDRQRRQRLIGYAHDGLDRADLMVELRVSQRLIARIGPRARPGLWSRLLGLGPVELKIVPILLSLFKR